MTVKQLQQLCREQNLSAQGRKADLIAHLAAQACACGAVSFFCPSSPRPPYSTPNPVPAPSTVGPDGPVQSSVSTQGLDEIDTLAAHDASQLARSFQDAFDGGESSRIEDDIDDTDANAPDSQDDDEPLVHVSGKCCGL